MSTPNQVVVRNSSGGIGFLGLLTIVLVILKAFEVITISWLWVFSPIWLPLVLLLGMGVLLGLGFLMVLAVKALGSGKK